MAITEKPTILVIGGAFHVPESYQSLKVALEAAGYDVVSTTLPSSWPYHLAVISWMGPHACVN